MGIYTDNTVEDSQIPSTYSWSLIKGADGTSITISSITISGLRENMI